MLHDREPQSFLSKRAALISAFFVIGAILIFVVTPVIAYEYLYRDKVYRGVSVADLAVDNLTKEEAREKLQSFIDDIYTTGLVFTAKDKTVAIKLTSVALDDLDLAYDLVTFDVDKMIENAYGHGRSGSWYEQIFSKAEAIMYGTQVPLEVELNHEKLLEALRQNFKDLEDPGREPRIVFESGGIVVTEEMEGTTFNYESAVDQAMNSLRFVTRQPVTLQEIPFTPKYIKDEVESAVPVIQEFLEKYPKITLRYQNKEWAISDKVYRELIYVTKTDEGEVRPAFEPIKTAAYLSENIAKEINTAPIDAKLTFSDDGKRVKEFTPHQPGLSLDPGSSALAVDKQLFVEGKGGLADLVVHQAEPAVAIDDLNKLGIKELIGVGESDYSGSPANRRHNIAVGANAFNGVLLAPGEEFSALKYIGDVNAAAGYLPELVIKGNETIPEYGGGLCQVSTTIFRAALNAGLEITQRRAHSYTVSYYSPIGTDATIYDPAPDFRFRNDTEAHILIHTVNDKENSKLYFEIWGTDPGRTVERTDPVVYDIVPAPPTKIVETTDLAPGQRRCTERAHNGAKAYFYRTIKYPDGTEKEERYDSQYRPWQAVCLVGVEPAPEEEKEESDTAGDLTQEDGPASEDSDPEDSPSDDIAGTN